MISISHTSNKKKKYQSKNVIFDLILIESDKPIPRKAYLSTIKITWYLRLNLKVN